MKVAQLGGLKVILKPRARAQQKIWACAASLVACGARAGEGWNPLYRIYIFWSRGSHQREIARVPCMAVAMPAMVKKEPASEKATRRRS